MSVFRPRSKIVSGMANAQAPFDRKGTSLGSRVGQAHRVTGAPRDELDPAITFYAPLQHSALDLGGAPYTFTRASDGLYLPYSGGDWRSIGNDRDRYESGKLLMEPAMTNKCTNYNASPDVALTNVTAGGAGTVTRVSDAEDIAEAGLSKVTSGFVIDVDATGVGATWATIGGTVANVNEHTLSAWVKKISGSGDVTIRLTDNSVVSAPITGTRYERVVVTGTPGLTTVSFQLHCGAGAKARFILNQLEESPVVTSPIVTQGAAGQRAIEELEYLNDANFFDNAAGTLIMRWASGYEALGQQIGTTALLTCNPSVVSQLYVQEPGATIDLKSYDGVNSQTLQIPINDVKSPNELTLAIAWQSGGNKELGYSLNGWIWANVVPYQGSWTSGGALTDMRINVTPSVPHRYSNIIVYNEAKSRSWIEANFP